MHKLQEKIKTEWSSYFAYAIGLITSDGWLSSDRRHIGFKSADQELIQKLQTALSLKNKIGRSGRGGDKTKKYFHIQFGDIAFYQFLNKIGLTAAKSKTINAVNVPDKFFADFLRGLFDGDGTFYCLRDTRWPNSFVFQISFASASSNFIEWLKHKLTKLYGVKGVICKGDGVFNIRYMKGDSKKLFSVMYYKNNLLFLNRKYLKIKEALKKDQKLGLVSLQKHHKAGLAHR